MSDPVDVVVDHRTALLWLSSYDRRPHSQVFLFPILLHNLPAGKSLTAEQACDLIVKSFREYLASAEFDAKPADAVKSVRSYLDLLFGRYAAAFLQGSADFIAEVEQHYVRIREKFLLEG